MISNYPTETAGDLPEIISGVPQEFLHVLRENLSPQKKGIRRLPFPLK
jgi:hypothetical protein